MPTDRPAPPSAAAPLPDPAQAEAALLARLDALGIPWTHHAHPPMRTVEESRALRGDMPGVHVKNLFLKDRARDFWLAVLEEGRRIRVGDLGRRAGARGLSFAGEDDLALRLGVRPGAVTPLALGHPGAGGVRALLDAAILEGPLVNVHPLHNAATLALAPADLLRFLDAAGHAPQVLDLGPPDPL